MPTNQPDATPQKISLSMVRETLEDIPSHPLSPDFEFVWYKSGNEEWWCAIQQACEGYTPAAALALYQREFAATSLLPQRQGFLLTHDGEPVGTITSWVDSPDTPADQIMGRIHWVAIVPKYQGRGLAKPMLSKALFRLRDLGHRSAYLVTDSGRPRAIRLYRDFGFAPMLDTDPHRAAWESAPAEVRDLFV